MSEAREEAARRPSMFQGQGKAKDELIRFVRDTRSKNAQALNIKGEVEDASVMCACVGVQFPMSGQTQIQ